MNNKDKQLLKGSALVVADQIASSIPALNIAWGLSKALFGAGMKLRQQRALEWVELIRDNPEVFTKELLEQEELQDGFVYAFEKYLVERSEQKRKIFRNIFLGFAKADDKRNFPLEKFSHTLSQLGEVDIEVLREVKIDEYGENYQIYGNNANRIDNIHSLINLGLLLNTTGTRGGFDPRNSPFVKFSPFGWELIKYLANERVLKSQI